MTGRIDIVASLAEARRTSADACILSPATRRFPPAVADLLGALPTLDANRLLIDALAAGERSEAPAVPVLAGVFAADPFLRVDRLAERLHAAGIGGVVNWPTSAVFDEPPRQVLQELDLGAAREAAVLQRFAAAGLAAWRTIRADGDAAAAASGSWAGLILLPEADDPAAPSADERAALASVARRVRAALAHGPAARGRPPVAVYAPVAPQDVPDWADGVVSYPAPPSPNSA